MPETPATTDSTTVDQYAVWVIIEALDEAGEHIGDEDPGFARTATFDAAEMDDAYRFAERLHRAGEALHGTSEPPTGDYEHAIPDLQPTITVGQMLDVLARFDRDLPVTMATQDWYVNIVGASLPDGSPSLILEQGAPVDTRQW